jgi:hypothetical protein
MVQEKLHHDLDDQFQDLLPLLNMNKVKRFDGTETKDDKSYERIAFNLREQQRAVPS